MATVFLKIQYFPCYEHIFIELLFSRLMHNHMHNLQPNNSSLRNVCTWETLVYKPQETYTGVLRCMISSWTSPDWLSIRSPEDNSRILIINLLGSICLCWAWDPYGGVSAPGKQLKDMGQDFTYSSLGATEVLWPQFKSKLRYYYSWQIFSSAAECTHCLNQH